MQEEKVVEVRNKKARVCGALAMTCLCTGVVGLIGTAGYVESVPVFEYTMAIKPVIISLAICAVGEFFRVIEEKNTKELTFTEYMSQRKRR